MNSNKLLQYKVLLISAISTNRLNHGIVEVQFGSRYSISQK